jgi:hypothetical protein
VFKDQERLTAGIINKICMAVDNVLCREGDASLKKRVFSESGSSDHIKEQGTYIHFCDFLEELEGNLISQSMLQH